VTVAVALVSAAIVVAAGSTVTPRHSTTHVVEADNVLANDINSSFSRATLRSCFSVQTAMRCGSPMNAMKRGEVYREYGIVS
jgi:hypothetical protein